MILNSGLEFLFPPSLGKGKAEARADILAAELNRLVDQRVEVTVAGGYPELAERTLESRVDVTWAPPWLCARAERKARAILKAVRGDGTTYRAALVCHVDHPVSMPTISGRSVAWIDRLSTAGYVLPRAYLREEGFDPDATLGTQAMTGSFHEAVRSVLARQVEFCPVYTHEATIRHVRQSLEELVGPLADRLVPFAYTRESPSDGLVITARPDDTQAAALLNLLRSDRAGPVPRVLLDVCGARGFIPATYGDYGHIRRGQTPTPGFL